LSYVCVEQLTVQSEMEEAARVITAQYPNVRHLGGNRLN
jgi:hypothetical protein